MSEYTVLLPFAGFDADQSVTEEQLEGCNVPALVAGGFLASATPTDPDHPKEPATAGG